MKSFFSILLVSVLILFLCQSLSVVSLQDTTNPPRNKVLMLTATANDSLIAQTISNTEPQLNYTISNLATINNLTHYLTTLNLHEYLSIMFIVSNSTSGISPNLIKTFSDFINNNGTLVFISSNIWQLNPALLNFLGISVPANSSHEYMPTGQQAFQFEITNISFNYLPYTYQLGDKISISSRVGVINPLNTSIYQIAESNDLDNRQNFTSYTGIYQTYGSTSLHSITCFALLIPISLINATDSETLQFMESLGHYAIHYSLLMSGGSIDPSQQTAGLGLFLENINILTIGEYLAAGVIVAGGFVITSKITSKTIYSLRPKKIDDTNNEQESLSTQESWFVGVLAVLIGIIGAILYSPNYKRMSLFQVLDNPVRKQIIKILEEYDFEHFNSLQRKLNIGVSILIWHLKILEEFNIVDNKKIGQYKVLYLVDNPPTNEQVIIYMTMKSKKALAILHMFLQSPACKIFELSDMAKFSNELIKYYCSKLYDLGFIYFNIESKQYILVHEKKDLLVWLFERYSKEV